MPLFSESDVRKQYEEFSHEKNEILNNLKNIIIDSKTPLEGNSFYAHETLSLYPELYTKQVNLFWCGKNASSRICEIGFNAGHSAMLMLLGRDKTPVDFTIFDIGHHAYTSPCLKYIETKFSNVNFEYIEGNSILTMSKWISDNPSLVGTYDLIHVDGGHTEECIINDMKHADILVKKGGVIVVDDTGCSHINSTTNDYINTGKYTELDVLTTYGYVHRVIQKIL